MQNLAQLWVARAAEGSERALHHWQRVQLAQEHSQARVEALHARAHVRLRTSAALRLAVCGCASPQGR